MKGVNGEMDLKKFFGKEYGNITDILNEKHEGKNEDASERRILEREKEYHDAEADGINLRRYSEKEYTPFQLREIKEGLRKKLSVDLYAKPFYTWAHMYEIRMGLEHGLDVSLYLEPMLLSTQMHEIRLGLEQGLDVRSYAKLIYSTSDMKLRRHLMFEEKYRECNTGYAREITDDYTKIKIRLADDLLAAYVTLPEGNDFTALEVIRALRENGITYGILKESIEKAISDKVESEFLAAEGVKLQVGRNGSYKMLTDSIKNPDMDDSDDMDVDLSISCSLNMVAAGQRIAVYHPASPGQNGMTVMGDEIRNHFGAELPKLQGNDIELLEDGRTYIAKRSGHIIYNSETFTIVIQDVMDIREDITFLSGPCFCDGSLRIRGNVGAGAVIDAKGDIIIDGYVQNAYISAGNNIVIAGGVNADDSGYIVAQQNVMANFFENANIHARSTIESNYIMNCTVHAGDVVRTKGVKGTICGGVTEAGSKIICKNAGNSAQTETKFVLGEKQNYVEALAAAVSQRVQTEREIKLLKKAEKHMIDSIPEELLIGNDTYVKIGFALRMKEALFDRLNFEVTELHGLIDRLNDISLNISGTAFPNINIDINGIKRIMDEELYYVSFIRKGKDIITAKFKSD